jgi:hypothetical protein
MRKSLIKGAACTDFVVDDVGNTEMSNPVTIQHNSYEAGIQFVESAGNPGGERVPNTATSGGPSEISAVQDNVLVPPFEIETARQGELRCNRQDCAHTLPKLFTGF